MDAFLSFATIEYSKLTEGVGSEFETIVPIVIVLLGTILGIAFAIRWASRKFGSGR